MGMMETDNLNALRLVDVGKTFGADVRAVDGVSTEIPSGQFVSFIGPSGCGKSTLLRMIAGLDQPTSGTIHCSSAKTDQSKIAYVFQDAHLLPWRNVLENAALPLELLGIDRDERLSRAEKVLKQVGLSDALKRYPAQLSGGMKMRVSLARALVTDPQLLLLDEPFAALDEISRQRLDDSLRELWLARKMTVIFVTHSIAEATFLAERAIVFSIRPARIILDHMITLPTDRPGSIRTSTAFAEQSRILFDALERGETA